MDEVAPEPVVTPPPVVASEPPPSSEPAHENREPWLGANLSLLFPGVGHFYAGRTRIGWMLLIAAFALIAIPLYCLVAANGNVGIGLFVLAEFLGLSILSVYGAHRVIARGNSPEFETERKQSKDGWLAFMLSRFLPGVGHFYLGNVGMGIILLIVFVLLSLLPNPFGSLLASLWVATACYLAYLAAPVHREPDQSKALRLAMIVAAFLVATDLAKLVVRDQWLQAFRMPSESMKPALQVSDYFWCDKRRSYEPKRGDVVVFQYPRDRTKDFVKRIIGMPGDRIEIRDKVVWLNGAPQNEPYAIHVDPVTRGVGDDRRDNLRPIVIAPGDYFVLGDNRDNSNDSRYFGAVPRELVRGRIYKIYWPLSRAGAIR